MKNRSNPFQTTLLLVSYLSIGILFNSCTKDQNDPAPNQPVEFDGYTLLWQDEFNQPSINLDNWNYETGDGTDYDLPPGWGNNEKQIYTTSPENAYITTDEDNQVLAITAKEDGNGGYTSAKLTTQNKFSFRFGKVVARIKLPQTKGLWPAFWMLGSNFEFLDWPGCGEIDILELIGSAPEKTLHTIHFTNGENSWEYISKDFILPEGTFSDGYHTFTLDWTPEEILFSVDGQEAHRVSIEADMKEFMREFYLILNVAVGGNLPGDPDQTTELPQTMFVDYVRVYAMNGFTPPAEPTLDIAEESLGILINDDIAVNSILENYPDFGIIKINSYGAGGEPEIIESEESVDGEKSLSFTYPGTNWGGAFFEMDQEKDFSGAANGNLIFSIKMPTNLKDAEIKLESSGQATSAAVFLRDYSPVDLGAGWSQYQIPMDHFTGLDLSRMRIPFSFWNPKDDNGNYFGGTILIDGIHISE